MVEVAVLNWMEDYENAANQEASHSVGDGAGAVMRRGAARKHGDQEAFKC